MNEKREERFTSGLFEFTFYPSLSLRLTVAIIPQEKKESIDSGENNELQN